MTEFYHHSSEKKNKFQSSLGLGLTDAVTAESRSHRQIEAIAFLVHYRNLTLLLRERLFMTDLYSHLGKKRISVIFGERFCLTQLQSEHVRNVFFLHRS